MEKQEELKEDIIEVVKQEHKIDEEIKEEKNVQQEIEDETKQLQAVSEEKNKKQFSIFGITIWRILAYFVLYSILGFFVETIFAFLAEGVIESRKSFLYGPFCAIYGVGAVVMIVGLQKCQKNNITLFIGGFVLGSIVEYLISLIGEIVFHVKWWDYSNMAFNIQGRICLTFSLAWGALGLVLLKIVNPRMDKIIDKIPVKFLKVASVTIVVFMFIDWIISSFAMQMFFTRIVEEHHIELKDGQEYIEICRDLYEIEWVRNMVDTLWNNEVMLKAFPNLRVTTKHGAVIYVSNLYKDIKPYYLKVFEPISLNKFEYWLTQKAN